MNHNFLFVGVKTGSNTAFHCFVLQRKLVDSIKYVVYEIKSQNLFMYIARRSVEHRTRALMCLAK